MLGVLAARITAAVVANLSQKRLLDCGEPATAVAAVSYLVTALAALPFASWPAEPTFWTAALSAGLLDAAGNLLLLHSLRTTDLSLLGPLAAFKPAVALLPAALLLGERPPVPSLAGITVVVAASWLLAPPWTLFRLPGVWFRLGSLMVFSLGAVYLKQAVAAGSTATTLLVWAGLGSLACGGPAAACRRALAAFWPAYATAAAATCLMQACTLALLAAAPVGPALALFQTGSALHVLVGWLWLGEPFGPRRLLASLLMGGGAALLLHSA